MNTTATENQNSEILEAEEVGELDENETDVEVIKAHAQKEREARIKAEETNKQVFARLKKAEGFTLENGKWVKPQVQSTEKTQTQTANDSKDGLKPSDLYALMKANVEEQDIDEVVEYAQLKKISVAQALQSTIVKTILSEKAENRKVAEGTNTGATRKSNSRLSDDALLENARSGKMPESEDEIARLIRARRAKK